MSRTSRRDALRRLRREQAGARRRLNRRFRHRVRAILRRDPDAALPLPPSTEGWESW